MIRIPIDPDSIRALAAVLVETGQTETEIAEKDSRIRVVRAGGRWRSLAGHGRTGARGPSRLRRTSAAIRARSQARWSGWLIFSGAGCAVFVTVGQQVTAGEILLLIEAMKTFNQIKAPKAGTVTRILVQTAHRWNTAKF